MLSFLKSATESSYNRKTLGEYFKSISQSEPLVKSITDSLLKCTSVISNSPNAKDLEWQFRVASVSFSAIAEFPLTSDLNDLCIAACQLYSPSSFPDISLDQELLLYLLLRNFNYLELHRNKMNNFFVVTHELML